MTKKNTRNTKNPEKYQKLLTGATLLHADINKDWDEAIFTFNNDLKVTVARQSDRLTMFISITKQVEPYKMRLDFEKKEIRYSNLVIGYKVGKRKDLPRPDKDE